jgi:hypothetical protein
MVVAPVVMVVKVRLFLESALWDRGTMVAMV